jgi:hypothetical protein
MAEMIIETHRENQPSSLSSTSGCHNKRSRTFVEGQFRALFLVNYLLHRALTVETANATTLLRYAAVHTLSYSVHQAFLTPEKSGGKSQKHYQQRTSYRVIFNGTSTD